MSMSRKDYEAIASILNKNLRNETMISGVALDLADYMAKDNPRFDKARFLEASLTPK